MFLEKKSITPSYQAAFSLSQKSVGFTFGNIFAISSKSLNKSPPKKVFSISTVFSNKGFFSNSFLKIN